MAAASSATKVTKVRHWTLGLKRLARAEVDVYVGSDEIIGAYLNNPEYKGLYRAGVIETMQLYVYLNKKHEKLAGNLSIVLAETKAGGLITEISRKVLMQEYIE